LLVENCRKFPNTIFGHRSFIYLRGVFKKRDRAQFIDWCRTMYKQGKAGELADNFLYEAARVHFERNTQNDDDRAIALYRKIVSRWAFETSALWDDALWDISEIQHRRGQFREEIKSLQHLLSTREFTTWIGSYEIRSYKHAAMRIGKVYYLDLKDYKAAAVRFAAFETEFRESRYVDDAIWWLGHSLAKAGRTTQAKATFKRLLATYPQSKFSRRVREGNQAP